MFTGLVEAVGEVRQRVELPESGGCRLTILHPLGELTQGESVSVDGACLTVVGQSAVSDALARTFDAELSPETLARTTLHSAREGTRVNLERALEVGERLGGHLVTGHVDAVARVVSVTAQGDMTRVWFEVPEELARYVASKGSATLSGVSLTVNDVEQNRFSVQLIPHTRAETTLGALAAGGSVNFEVDLIARYVSRLLAR
jgi:riboflavin synthase